MHMGTGLHEQALADAVVRMVGAGARLDRTYHVPHVPHVPHGPTACPLHARLTWRVLCGVVWCGVVWEASRSAPVSSYTMQYPDRCVALVLAGEATLTCGQGKGAKPLTLTPGQLLTIPEGNTCTWRIASPLMMHYNYGY